MQSIKNKKYNLFTTARFGNLIISPKGNETLVLCGKGASSYGLPSTDGEPDHAMHLNSILLYLF